MMYNKHDKLIFTPPIEILLVVNAILWWRAGTYRCK